MKIDSLSAGEKRVYDYMKANGGITTLEAIQKRGGEMTGRYVLRNKTDKTYYRANRKGNWDNWVDNINLATVFYTNAINTQHRCMKDCDIVYVKFEEVL